MAKSLAQTLPFKSAMDKKTIIELFCRWRGRSPSPTSSRTWKFTFSIHSLIWKRIYSTEIWLYTTRNGDSYTIPFWSHSRSQRLFNVMYTIQNIYAIICVQYVQCPMCFSIQQMAAPSYRVCYSCEKARNFSANNVHCFVGPSFFGDPITNCVPKENRFGLNLQHFEYIVGGWPRQTLGAIREVARDIWKAAEICLVR